MKRSVRPTAALQGRIRALAALVSLFVAVVAVAATAAPPKDALQEFVQSVDQFSARFEQVQKDEQGKVLQTSGGRLWIARPEGPGKTGRFRWAYETPYPQLMVCDGTSLWMHDPDLDQVTRRPAGASLQGTPAQLLTDRAALEKHFKVEPAGREGGATRVRLVPLNPDSDFKSIELWLAKGAPQRMRFIDPLGGSSDITFREVDTATPVDPALFRFEVPKGAELVEAQ